MKPQNPYTDLFIFLACMTVLFIGWLLSGGLNRDNLDDKFINPPDPIGAGGTYDETVFTDGKPQLIPSLPRREQ